MAYYQPFAFQPRRGKLDWRSLSKLDLDRVVREVDIDSLEKHLQGVAFADVTADDLHWFSEADFMQLFRLLQLVCEYLLYVQETLHRRNVTLESTLGTAESQLRDQAEYIGVLEAQLGKSGGGPPGMYEAPVTAIAKCLVCRKAFSTDAFLQAHIKRRHPGHWQPPQPTTLPCRPSTSAASLPSSALAHASSSVSHDEVQTVKAEVRRAADATGSGAFGGCTSSQLDAAVQSAVAELQQSVRAEIGREMPELRASIERTLTIGLSETLASSIQAELDAEGAVSPSVAEGGGSSALLSEQVQRQLAQQTAALKAQMDGLQHELVAQRSLLEQRMQEAASKATDMAASASAVQEATREALGAAVQQAATTAASQAAKEAAHQAAREAAQLAAKECATMVLHEAKEVAAIQAKEVATTVAREAAEETLRTSAGQGSRERGAAVSKLGGELLDDDDDAVVSSAEFKRGFTAMEKRATDQDEAIQSLRKELVQERERSSATAAAAESAAATAASAKLAAEAAAAAASAKPVAAATAVATPPPPPQMPAAAVTRAVVTRAVITAVKAPAAEAPLPTIPPVLPPSSAPAKPPAATVAKPPAATVAKQPAATVAKPPAATVAKPPAATVAKPLAATVAKPPAATVASAAPVVAPKPPAASNPTSPTLAATPAAPVVTTPAPVVAPAALVASPTLPLSEAPNAPYMATVEKRLREAFALIDLDESGTLTRGELMRGCREKESVRTLMGLPRNLRGDVAAQGRFDALFAKLDTDGSGNVTNKEFIAYFTSSEGQQAVETLSGPPAWLTVAEGLKLDPFGEPAVRTREGFRLWQPVMRFEHMEGEWGEEHQATKREVAGQMAQWDLGGVESISSQQMEDLLRRKRANLERTCVFPRVELVRERKAVEEVLAERVAKLYKTLSPAELRALPARLPGDLPGDLPDLPGIAASAVRTSFAADMAQQRPLTVPTPPLGAAVGAPTPAPAVASTSGSAVPGTAPAVASTSGSAAPTTAPVPAPAPGTVPVPPIAVAASTARGPSPEVVDEVDVFDDFDDTEDEDDGRD